MASVEEAEGSIGGFQVRVHIIEELSHEQVFEEIDKVFATMLAITQSSQHANKRMPPEPLSCISWHGRSSPLDC
jgi:hypothetical protein